MCMGVRDRGRHAPNAGVRCAASKKTGGRPRKPYLFIASKLNFGLGFYFLRLRLQLANRRT